MSASSGSDTSLPLAADWYARIAGSQSTRELVMVARAFMDTWSAEDLAQLPPGLRPGRIDDGEDIASIAYDLAQAHLRVHLPAPAERLATRMHAFFSNASARAAILSARRNTLP